MILLAVGLGYILGVAPFITYYLIKQKENKVEEVKQESKEKEMQEIFDEYINGTKKAETKPEDRINQMDMYKEYVTGIEVK